MNKPLSKMLEEIEPPFVQSKLLKESAWVDRASYEKLRQVAIVLSESCEKNRNKLTACKQIGFNIFSPNDVIQTCDEALTRAKDIIGGKDE